MLPTGEMLWYRHLRQAGVFHWAHGGIGQQIGDGWQQYARVFAGSDGVIYAMTAGGDLLLVPPYFARGPAPVAAWRRAAADRHRLECLHARVCRTQRRHLRRAVGRRADVVSPSRARRRREWENGGTGVQIGSGWGDQTVALEGYATPLSAAPGERIDFRTSTSASHYTVTYLHLKPGPSGSIGTSSGAARCRARTPAARARRRLAAWQRLDARLQLDDSQRLAFGAVCRAVRGLGRLHLPHRLRREGAGRRTAAGSPCWPT